MINLFDFTYCGDYNRQIQNLARMVPEKWSFSDTEDNGILKGYLEHTFKRLYEEKKVWERKNYAIFNTGLFNYYYQPIYAYFIPNLVPDRQLWFLDGFYTEYYLLKDNNIPLTFENFNVAVNEYANNRLFLARRQSIFLI